MTSLFTDIVSGREPAFALICRDGGVTLDVFAGSILTVDSLTDIPLSADVEGPAVIAAVPFRQISERGFECHDDGAPLQCLVIERHETISVATAVAELPSGSTRFTEGGFDQSDDEYARVVDRIVTNEIAHGAGANFVIRRDFTGTLAEAHAHSALKLLRCLLEQEVGAYWTFAFVTADLALVGATPERHVSARAGTVMMNPISGTFRHGDSMPGRADILEFLADPKETDELFMVVDEELKMMAKICDKGGQVLGPYLKQMGNLTHTEYLLRGESSLDVRDIIRATMFAPTVTGSPIENAARIIRRYEGRGRGYYSGVLALIGHDDVGQTLDAPILIRTCEMMADGRLKASVGATLVRASDPDTEVAETHAKLAGLLQALGATSTRARARMVPTLTDYADVREALAARNTSLAGFWIDRQPNNDRVSARRTAAVIDCEDEWTSMLGHQLRYLGMDVEIRRWDDVPEPIDADLLVLGPGPGDPTKRSQARIATIDALARQRLAAGQPLIAICLSHQVLASRLGFRVQRLPVPYQGSQREIELFGQRRVVGLYNSFAAFAGPAPADVEAACDASTGVVYGLRGPGFASVQFHPESILTTDGIDILRTLVDHAMSEVVTASQT